MYVATLTLSNGVSAELTANDICPPTARAAGALKRAWRELVASKTTRS